MDKINGGLVKLVFASVLLVAYTAMITNAALMRRQRKQNGEHAPWSTLIMLGIMYLFALSAVLW